MIGAPGESTLPSEIYGSYRSVKLFTSMFYPDFQSTPQDSLAALHIPLHVVSHTPRTTLPARILSILSDWNAHHLFANIEYEIDELRRDIKVCELSRENGKIGCTFVHDKCIIEPGLVKTKEGKAYTVCHTSRNRRVC